LANAPDHLKIESRARYATETLACSLVEARRAPEGLHPTNDREVSEFRLTLSKVPGLNRDGGKGSFSDSIVELTKQFYSQVLQSLRAWKEPAPRLVPRQPETREVQERVVETIPAIAPAVRKAQSEAEGLSGEQSEGIEGVEKDL
jgi:hypothetical protein